MAIDIGLPPEAIIVIPSAIFLSFLLFFVLSKLSTVITKFYQIVFGFFAIIFGVIIKIFSGILSIIYRKLITGWGKKHYLTDCYIFGKKPVMISNAYTDKHEEIIGSKRFTALIFQYFLFLPTFIMILFVIYGLIPWKEQLVGSSIFISKMYNPFSMGWVFLGSFIIGERNFDYILSKLVIKSVEKDTQYSNKGILDGWDKNQTRAWGAFLTACVMIFSGVRYLLGVFGIMEGNLADSVSMIITFSGIISIRMLVLDEIVEEIP